MSFGWCGEGGAAASACGGRSLPFKGNPFVGVLAILAFGWRDREGRDWQGNDKRRFMFEKMTSLSSHALAHTQAYLVPKRPPRRSPHVAVVFRRRALPQRPHR
jgi:hypothetical protein